MKNFYFVRTKEKLEIALSDVFNDIYVNKYTDLERVDYSKTVKVPLVLQYDGNFANWYDTICLKKKPMPLPIAGLRYDRKEQNSRNRTQATYCRNVFSKATDKWIQDIQPNPYYLYYTLEFLMDSKSDFEQITENIIPYFNPFRTLRIKEWDFAPDIERKIPILLTPAGDDFKDEIQVGPNHRYITTKFTIRAEVDFYRPFELPEIIKYAELNIHVDDFIHSHQVLVYPDPIAEQEKKAWEQLLPSTKTGYMLLKTTARTIVKELQLDGTTLLKEVTVPDAVRPIQVPDFKLLSLNFDQDQPLVTDDSGYGRDFVVLNDSTRQFISNFPPGGGQLVEDGYKVDTGVSWNRILDWFGTNDGLHESPFTFSIILQFNSQPIVDTVFQYLVNNESVDSDGNVIPAGEVFFDWGLIDSKLYFSFRTYGTNALSYVFSSKDQLTFLNSSDIYKFEFVLYDSGHEGMFGYTINSGPTVALETIRD